MSRRKIYKPSVAGLEVAFEVAKLIGILGGYQYEYDREKELLILDVVFNDELIFRLKIKVSASQFGNVLYDLYINE